jgi:ribosomal protein L16 Arg81 hydroxylase
MNAAALSRSEFEAKFLEKQPVILRNVANNSYFAQLVQKASLLQNFGDSLITLSSANRNSYAKREETLRRYVEGYIHVPQSLNASGADSWYHFGDNKHDEWSDVFRHYVLPAKYTFGPYSSLSFGIGSSGSGVPFHTHGHVFAEVFYGRKRWWLQAPHSEPRFDGDQSSLYWLTHVYPTLSPEEKGRLMECVCDVGDMLYIPGLWHHATLNMGQTVFMSIFV